MVESFDDPESSVLSTSYWQQRLSFSYTSHCHEANLHSPWTILYAHSLMTVSWLTLVHAWLDCTYNVTIMWIVTHLVGHSWSMGRCDQLSDLNFFCSSQSLLGYPQNALPQKDFETFVSSLQLLVQSYLKFGSVLQREIWRPMAPLALWVLVNTYS